MTHAFRFITSFSLGKMLFKFFAETIIGKREWCVKKALKNPRFRVKEQSEDNQVSIAPHRKTKGDIQIMIRTKLWFRCAAMHDPVTPVIVKPALIGWDAKKRDVELTIERAFKGDELVLRMQGWVTVDVKKVIEIVKRYGFLKVLDERDLVVEVETEKDLETLNREILETFGDQLNLETI